ncbi:hypothetical protein BDZ97DRAFT_1922248 [Flammula alnicola]|nr:hypothetical protein BDZ97DRAFT_1922248 [Flammula alnicola]
MSTASLLSQLLLGIRRLLSRIMKPGVIQRALGRILRRLAFLGSIFRSRLRFGGKGIERPPPSSQGEQPTSSKEEPQVKEDLKEQASQVDSQQSSVSYTITRTGDTISLEGVSPSLYPFSSGGIRNTSRSSIRSGQNLSTRSRNASRSSRHPESNYSHSAAGSTFELDAFHPTRHRPVHFRPRRQYSTSAPDLLHPYDVHPSRHRSPPRSHRRSPSPVIEVTSPIEVNSPGHISQTSLHIPSTSRGSSPQSYNQPITEETIEGNSWNNITAEVIPLPSGQSSINEGSGITPVVPNQTKRYERRTKMRDNYPGKLRNQHTYKYIEPLTSVFNKPAPPPGWIRYAHPEGARYFYHPEKKVYTDADVYDPPILEHMMEVIERLENSIPIGKSLPDNWVIMIDVGYKKDSDGFECTYYYVDHDARAIFFLDTFDTVDMDSTWEVRGAKTDLHLGYEIQAQYWYFVQLYPSSLELSTSLVSELRDILLHFIGDSMTSPFSTASYTLDNLFKILGLTGELEKNVGPDCVGSMSLFARQMYIFYHSRFLNFHGESFARIERDFSVFGDPLNRRTWLIKTISFVLFSAPDVHLRTLQKMWVDGIMHKSVWEQSMKNMNDEWQEFIFFATVMLTSNVGFLAIQSVDTHVNLNYRSPAQIASYLSVFADTGSIILGLLLMRQNRTKSRETADDVQRFLLERSHPHLGLETLAILYSLPYALLMWGTVAFIAAFCFVCFQGSNTGSRSLVGSLCAAVAVLIVWCIYTSWEKKHDQGEDDRRLAYEDQLEQLEESEGVASQEPDEKEQAKHTLLNRLWNLPVILSIRRGSYDSGQTAV